jgi:Tfp pilus assembly protein PilW
MVCKTTSTRRARQRSAGFSIAETWIALGLTMLLVLATVSFTMYTGRSFAGLGNYVDLEMYSQKALDQMTRDIRQTKYLSAFATNQLVFQDSDDTPLSFTYSPTARTLVRAKGGASTVLLRECDYMCFSNFIRNPIPQTDGQYPVSLSVSNTKLISVTWVCSRTVTGTKLNTESVQTAKIVIRKQ